MTVRFCVAGGRVANESCMAFGEVENRSVVKLTAAEIREIASARGAGLVEPYSWSSYIYFVDDYGNGINWNGFNGREVNNYPCLVCNIHSGYTVPEDNQDIFDTSTW